MRQIYESIKVDENAIINSMHQIKEIGKECLLKLKQGDVDWFGRSLDLHWNIKKQISPKMTDNQIDKWYMLAIKNGALGGKIIGAGGGGFLIFYCNNIDDRSKLRHVMAKQGLKEVKLKIDQEGTKILLNI
jgi:D-glycero-alpha-D-manno-heptose-7-phosphate kinase